MIIVYTTIETFEQAEDITKILLAERLIACINMWPIHSMYSFNGKLVKTEEVGMYFKTTSTNQNILYKRLTEIHPYECPAIITLNVEHAHPPFTKWIQEQINVVA